LKFGEKLRAICRIIRAKHKLIVFDCEAIYGQSAVINADSNISIDEAKKLLEETLDHVIPAGYKMERHLVFSEKKYDKDKIVLSVRSYPPRKYYDLVMGAD